MGNPAYTLLFSAPDPTHHSLGMHLPPSKCGSSRWSWHCQLMLMCRPRVQTTVPFFWHLVLIKYYHTSVSLCASPCVSLWCISLWPFYCRKMPLLPTRTKLFKDCLRKKFQLTIHLGFCPPHLLARELSLALDHRWPKGVASCR